MKRLLIISAVILCLIPAFIFMKSSNTIRYVSLGDSYTYGQGTRQPNYECYPAILTKQLNDNGIDIKLVANPAVSGFTTKDLIDNELSVCANAKPDFVTLLIGVNDWVQGVDSATYHKNLIYILDHVQAIRTIHESSLLLITLPDFGATSTGKIYGNDRDIEKGLTEFNNIIKNEARKRNIQVVDIYPLSQNVKNDDELTSADGLHPSEKGYAAWEKLIFPIALKMLKK